MRIGARILRLVIAPFPAAIAGIGFEVRQQATRSR